VERLQSEMVVAEQLRMAAQAESRDGREESRRLAAKVVALEMQLSTQLEVQQQQMATAVENGDHMTMQLTAARLENEQLLEQLQTKSTACAALGAELASAVTAAAAATAAATAAASASFSDDSFLTGEEQLDETQLQQRRARAEALKRGIRELESRAATAEQRLAREVCGCGGRPFS
jgi:hypothetical protein